MKKKRRRLRSDEDWTPEEIKRLRLALGMTQFEFAVELGYGTQAISLWETGKSRPLKHARDLFDRLAVERGGRGAAAGSGR